MSVVTVRARDSQRAMDEVIRRLGEDAFILSTRHAGGMVEIRAARDAQAQDAQAQGGPRFAVALAEAAAQPAAAAPNPLPDVAALARRLLPPDARADWQPARIVLAGPPGAGKSMLAARLAARILRDGSGRRPRLIMPQPGPRLTDDRLRGWARLMGLVPELPHVQDAAALPDPDPMFPEIVDLSDVAAHAVELAGLLAAAPQTEVLLCLPAGLHPARIASLAASWQGFDATVCLTHLDQWEPEADELSAIAAAGLKLRLLADGGGLLDALRLAEAGDIAHWAAGWTAPASAFPAAEAALSAPCLATTPPAETADSAPVVFFHRETGAVPVFRHKNRNEPDTRAASPAITPADARETGGVVVLRSVNFRAGDMV